MRPLRFKTLAGRYAAATAGLAIAMLAMSGGMEMYFSFIDSREQISRAQTVQARAAAAEIGQHLASVRAGLKGVTQLPWSRPDFDVSRRREEFYRLMVLFPGIVELQLVGPDGRERLGVSRMATDRLQSLAPVNLAATQRSLAPGAAAFGDVYFVDRAQPHVTLAMAGQDDGGLITVATLDLRFLYAVISELQVDGSVLILDRANMLIAHSQATHVMRHLDLSPSAVVQSVRRAPPADGAEAAQGLASTDLEGRPVIATAVRIPTPDWLLLIEKQRSDALRPALATLGRTMALLAIAILVTIAASLVFARRMAAPIVRMRRATERIASGDFASRVAPIPSGDEVERLGQDFNRMASALEASYSELEARIEARTRELREARDAAERASTAKTRFLAAASHDLRQPMHTIGLLATVLRGRLDNEDDLRLATKLQACTGVMEDLFASLLDISKLDAGIVTPHPESFPVGDLLARVGSNFEPQASQKGLVLRVRASRALVRSDPALLERILANLVSNAVRYTHQGKVLVGCRRRGDRLALQVIDTGPGIAQADLALIFEEFVRLDTAVRSSDDKGLGLGLSIVQRSAKVLGHALQVRSQPGHGSCFEIIVPCVGTMADGSPAQWALHAGAAPLHGALAGVFVLIIDDDEGNRQSLESMCLQWGGSVLACASADAACTELARHLRAPDLLVTDLRLGARTDGFAALRQVRQACGEDLPAVIVTADIDAAAAAEAAGIGVPLLHKPVAAARLLEVFIRLLRDTTAAQG